LFADYVDHGQVGCNRDEILASGRSPSLPMIFLTNRAFADGGRTSAPALLRLEFFVLLAHREALF